MRFGDVQRLLGSSISRAVFKDFQTEICNKHARGKNPGPPKATGLQCEQYLLWTPIQIRGNTEAFLLQSQRCPYQETQVLCSGRPLLELYGRPQSCLPGIG